MTRGFTLLECLLYIAIMSFLITGVQSIFSTIAVSSTRIRAAADALNEQIVSERRIRSENAVMIFYP